MGPKAKDPVPVIVPDAAEAPPMAFQPGPVVVADEKVWPVLGVCQRKFRIVLTVFLGLGPTKADHSS